MNPSIIYEDDYLLAVNKPSGLIVHAGVGSGYTLADWVLEQYPSLSEVGEPFLTAEGVVIPRPGMVHRLDKETSGVLLLAKHQEAFLTLKEHFRKQKVVKEYHAFIYGRPRRVRGSIHATVGRSRRDFRKQSVRDIRGKERESLTEYVVAGSCKNDASFIRCYPKTGRTHQIRVHLHSINCPVICDPLYAPSRPPLLGFSRLALHARRVTVTPHWSDHPLVIVADYPDDFVQALSYCSTIQN